MRIAFCLLFGLFCFVGCDSGASGARPIDLSAETEMMFYDDFSGTPADWREFSGKWLFAGGVIRQTSTRDHFPLILNTARQYQDLDISVDFKAISGRIDASGGVVFRAVDRGNYYIVRANSLEDNFRLYTFKDGNRWQIATATVAPPALGVFHTIRVVAQGDHIQAYLNGLLLLDHHDQTFRKGYVGLWTKADSVTEFAEVHVAGTE